MVRLLLIALAALPAAAEPLELPRAWWDQPAEPGRHTMLAAPWDGGPSARAALGLPDAGGFGMSTVEGRFGQAIAIAERGGHVHFRGDGNIHPDQGTLRLFIKGDVWADPEPRWLWEARGDHRIGVLREPGAISLRVSEGWSAEPLGRVDVPLGEVDPAAWHSLVASWDRASGRGWLAFDGAGASGELAFPAVRDPYHVLFVGSGFHGRGGGLNLPGLAFDELEISSQPLPVLLAEPPALDPLDAELLPRTEAGVRRCFDTLLGLQRWGGWQTLYSWPTLIGSSAQGREYLSDELEVSNDKSSASPRTGALFAYAGEVLADDRYSEAARRTGEMLLAAQDPRGFWSHAYRMTVRGMEPLGNERNIKLQDSDQSHPIYLFSLLHRLTGDERYLEGLKRAGAFYLAAQNPNGSWPHHYDAVDGVGENAIGQPGGGELNDLATNDAIDVMVLMHHVTGERAYLEAVKRTGQWLIDAQLEGATRGWADQYGPDNAPAWARAFEPPASSATATTLAARALVEIHRLSGDDRYLQPIRDCIAWLEETFPEGQVPYFLDPATGRPIAAWERKVYFLDEPASIEYLRTVPIGSGYQRTVGLAVSLERTLATAERPSLAPDLSPAALAERMAALRTAAENGLATQNEDGLWTVPVVADYMGSLGQGFASFPGRAVAMLRYAEAARMLRGELPTAWRGDGQILRQARPTGDWYEVDW